MYKSANDMVVRFRGRKYEEEVTPYDRKDDK